MSHPLQQSPCLSGRHLLWYGDELGAADTAILPTGHAALDAQLPGGGWPVGAMSEVLLPSPERHVWPLLLPALAAAARGRGGPVVLVGAPFEPFGPALAAGGLPPEAVLWVRGDAPLWACEQALRCADVAAVLAWLPQQARVAELRRLQLAAAQHEALLFVCRPDAAAQSASPARLRLRAAAGEGGRIDIRILKRRGPPLAAPLSLPAHGERLSALLAASRWRRGPAQAADAHMARVVRLGARPPGEGHALDRLAMAA